MLPIPLIVIALLLAAAPLSAAPYHEPHDAVHEDEPRGEHRDDRWQGRQLFDETGPDPATEGHASGDGEAANAQARCRMVPVRVRRPDGSSALSHIRRCD